MDTEDLLEKLKCLVYPCDDGENEYKWINDFRKECEEFGPTMLANHLVMMGANTAADCGADYSHDPHDIDKDPTRHDELHIVYNTLVWRALWESGKMFAVRTVIKRDVRPETRSLSEHDTDNDYGKIVLKTYGRKLLEHFLKSKPSPDWVLSQ